MDLYNGEIVAYKIDNKQDQSLVNDTLNQIVIDIVENYIKNYNNNRIQQKLGYLAPVKYRELAA